MKVGEKVSPNFSQQTKKSVQRAAAKELPACPRSLAPAIHPSGRASSTLAKKAPEHIYLYTVAPWNMIIYIFLLVCVWDLDV
jgi:hypothetical protein